MSDIFSLEFWRFAGTGLLIILAGALFLRLLPRVVDRIFDRTPILNRIDKTTSYFLSDSLGIALLILLGIFALDNLPENGKLIALIVTVASGAFIFTTEGWAQDALAGLSLQLYPQYHVGDWVSIGDAKRGRVIRVGLFRTYLETLELDIVTIKNSRILGEDVINHSGLYLRQVEVILHTAGYGEYGDSMTAYKADVLAIAKRVQEEICPEAKKDYQKEPEVLMLEFGSSSDHIYIIYYTYDQDEVYRPAIDAMCTALAEELRPKGVVLGQVNANTIDNVVEVRSA